MVQGWNDGSEDYNKIYELKQLLREAYTKIPQDRLGKSVCIDPDPAGSTYEFTEYNWSKRIRKLLDITIEPTGI